MTRFEIPETTRAGLRQLPQCSPAALLMRHSVREEIPEGTYGMDVPLTEEGVLLAEDFGRILGPRIGSVHTSPVPRCVETAEAIVRGTGLSRTIKHEPTLGGPGAFVTDPSLAGPTYLKLGAVGMAQALVRGEELPGFNKPAEAVTVIVQYLLSSLSQPGHTSVHVTHDAILAVVVGRLVGWMPTTSDWPDFLEAALLHSNGKRKLAISWKGRIELGQQ